MYLSIHHPSALAGAAPRDDTVSRPVRRPANPVRALVAATAAALGVLFGVSVEDLTSRT